MSYYERESKVALMWELERRGWETFGYKEDQSDMMTDYYSPASWDGTASKNGYVLVIDQKYGFSLSGRKIYDRNETMKQYEIDSKLRDRLKKLQALADDAGAPEGEKSAALFQIEKLQEKHGLKKIEPKVIETYPEFKNLTPDGCNWHVEKDGVIIVKGSGINSLVKTWERNNAEDAARVSAMADKIEAAFSSRTQWEQIEEKTVKTVQGFRKIERPAQFVKGETMIQINSTGWTGGNIFGDVLVFTNDYHSQKRGTSYIFSRLGKKGEILNGMSSRNTFTTSPDHIERYAIKQDSFIFVERCEVEEITTKKKWVKVARTISTYQQPKEDLLQIAGDVAEVVETVGESPKAKPAKKSAPVKTTASVSGVIVSINEEKNGVEIRFPGKPSADVLTAVKSAGFRWNGKTGVWYARKNDKNVLFAQSLAGQDAEEVATTAEMVKDKKQYFLELCKDGFERFNSDSCTFGKVTDAGTGSNVDLVKIDVFMKEFKEYTEENIIIPAQIYFNYKTLEFFEVRFDVEYDGRHRKTNNAIRAQLTIFKHIVKPEIEKRLAEAVQNAEMVNEETTAETIERLKEEIKETEAVYFNEMKKPGMRDHIAGMCQLMHTDTGKIGWEIRQLEKQLKEEGQNAETVTESAQISEEVEKEMSPAASVEEMTTPAENIEVKPWGELPTVPAELSDRLHDGSWIFMQKKRDLNAEFKSDVFQYVEQIEELLKGKETRDGFEEIKNALYAAITSYIKFYYAWFMSHYRTRASVPNPYVTGRSNYNWKKLEQANAKEGESWKRYEEIKERMEKAIKRAKTALYDALPIVDKLSREFLKIWGAYYHEEDHYWKEYNRKNAIKVLKFILSEDPATAKRLQEKTSLEIKLTLTDLKKTAEAMKTAGKINEGQAAELIALKGECKTVQGVSMWFDALTAKNEQETSNINHSVDVVIVSPVETSTGQSVPDSEVTVYISLNDTIETITEALTTSTGTALNPSIISEHETTKPAAASPENVQTINNGGAQSAEEVETISKRFEAVQVAHSAPNESACIQIQENEKTAPGALIDVLTTEETAGNICGKHPAVVVDLDAVRIARERRRNKDKRHRKTAFYDPVKHSARLAMIPNG